MFVIAAVRCKNTGYSSKKHGISYWCGYRWGSKFVAIKYETEEEASLVDTDNGESYTWDYPVGVVCRFDESPEI